MSGNRQERAGKVQTVLGLINPDQLGITLPHEHLLVDATMDFVAPTSAGDRCRAYEPVSIENLNWLHFHWRENLPNMQVQDEEVAIEEVMQFKKEGGGTIVELTSGGLSRDPLGLAHISRMTGINVVMGSGYYKGKAQGPDYDRKTEDEITEEIVADIEAGVGDSGVRAGIIGEVGCSCPLQDGERKSLRATARAQQQTGAAISIHQEALDADSLMEIVKILDGAGADISRVVMGHIDANILPSSARLELAKTGCYLEYDNFGFVVFGSTRPGLPPELHMPCDRERIEQIIELINEGYLEQILVSQDICNKMMMLRYGGHGYTHILRNMVPQMLLRGITREQIHIILVENPKRMLSFSQAM